MNFRSFRYFLTVCEMGTINAAARKLYISQQSLSQHIRKMEEELGCQLFHRDNPLVLTEAGRCVEATARTVLGALNQMQARLGQLQGSRTSELTIGMLDYGTPDFVPPLIDLFLRSEKGVMLKTREIAPGDPLPPDIPLFFSARELGGGYRSEVLFSDKLVVCLTDELLRRTYGKLWREHKTALSQGDLSALTGCPFLQHRNTPLQPLSEMAFQQNHFKPDYLPIMGTTSMLSRLCIEGQAAIVSFLGQADHELRGVNAYLLKNIPESLPAGYICYRADTVLPGAAQSFLNITRRYFKRTAAPVFQKDAPV